MIRSGLDYLKCIVPTNNIFPVHCLSGKHLHVCVLVLQDMRYGCILSKSLTGPPLSRLFHRLHMGLLQVTHDSNHQPNPCIHIHPIHHCYKGCKRKQVSTFIFQIGGIWFKWFYIRETKIIPCKNFATSLPAPVDVCCTLVWFDIFVEHH